jgi:hypothetical protein
MNPLRLDVMIPIRVRCSAPDCTAHAELPSLPLTQPALGAPLELDRAEVAAGLPAGWKSGSMRPRGRGLILDGAMNNDPPVPVAFCAEHNPERGR